MKNNVARTIRIDIDMLEAEIYVAFNYNSLDKLFKKLKVIKEHRTIEKDGSPKCASVCTDNGMRLVIISFDGDITVQDIVHESVHAAYFILDRKDIQIDITNHEVLAYMVDYITGQITDYLEITQVYKQEVT